MTAPPHRPATCTLAPPAAPSATSGRYTQTYTHQSRRQAPTSTAGAGRPAATFLVPPVGHREKAWCRNLALKTTPIRCTGSRQGAQIPPYKQPQSDVQGADRAPRSRPTNNPSQTYREQTGRPDPALQTTPVRRTGSRQGAQIPPYKQPQSDVQGSRQGAVIPPYKQSQSDVQGAVRAPRSRTTNTPSHTYREQTRRPDPALQTTPIRRTGSRQGAQIPPYKQPQSDVQGADKAPSANANE